MGERSRVRLALRHAERHHPRGEARLGHADAARDRNHRRQDAGAHVDDERLREAEVRAVRVSRRGQAQRPADLGEDVAPEEADELARARRARTSGTRTLPADAETTFSRQSFFTISTTTAATTAIAPAITIHIKADRSEPASTSRSMLMNGRISNRSNIWTMVPATPSSPPAAAADVALSPCFCR